MRFAFDDTYAKLPTGSMRVSLTLVRAPQLVKVNRALADWLGLMQTRLRRAKVSVLAGNTVLEGAAPTRSRTLGTNRLFVPQLGDGRAILLGELVSRDGRRRDAAEGRRSHAFLPRGRRRARALGLVLEVVRRQRGDGCPRHTDDPRARRRSRPVKP